MSGPLDRLNRAIVTIYFYLSFDRYVLDFSDLSCTRSWGFIFLEHCEVHVEIMIVITQGGVITRVSHCKILVAESMSKQLPPWKAVG